MEAEQTYLDRRHDLTTVDIGQCHSDPSQLRALLAARRKLARIYADDGEIRTAHAIETIDIALIEAALCS